MAKRKRKSDKQSSADSRALVGRIRAIERKALAMLRQRPKGRRPLTTQSGQSDSQVKRQGWRSPKAWLITSGCLAAAWVGTYLVTKDPTTAYIVTGFLLFLGIAGTLIT